MTKEQATYSHGHHESVVRSHSWRTAQNSAAFLLPHIRPTDSILDIGCGPGTITTDLAKIVPDGNVIGVDAVGSVLDQARRLAISQDIQNVTFEEVDANKLSYADASFDIVFAHQLLQHVKEPVAILKEMRRVVKPGGIVAARDGDYSSFAWYPETEGLTKWLALYDKVARANGGEPNAGRCIHAWARKAGFKMQDIQCTVTSWCYSKKDETDWWSQTWSDRVLHSGFAETALVHGFATKDELEELSQSWRQWNELEDCWFAVPSGEILCRRSAE